MAARELYIKSLTTRGTTHSYEDENAAPTLVVRKEKVKPVIVAMATGVENQENQPTKKRPANYVYGARQTAAKTRRCGECEGCMRDDCGQCVACLDKPRFGGKGTKKRACVERLCRMKGGIRTSAASSPVVVSHKRSASDAFADELEADLEPPPPTKKIHV